MYFLMIFPMSVIESHRKHRYVFERDYIESIDFMSCIKMPVRERVALMWALIEGEYERDFQAK